MSRPPTPRLRAIVAAVACAAHLAVLGPAIGDASGILDRGFGPQGEAIAGGAEPYAEIEFEYPPFAIPVIAAGAVASDSSDGFREAFTALMLVVDLLIVVILAVWAGRSRAGLYGAVATYTAGVLALSELGPLPRSAIDEIPLVLARFDLIPAVLALGAVLASAAGRSAAWGALAATGAALKGFPLLVAPAAGRDERRWGRVIAGAAVPVAVAAAITVWAGGGLGSAIGFHAERDLHVEAVAATPIEIAHLLGAQVGVITGNGSFNIDAGAAGVGRAISIAVLLLGTIAVSVAVLRRRAPVATGATAILAVAVAAAPVLSPQFLLWLLPLSALAFGASRENAVLIATFVMTQVMLSEYAGVTDLDPGFVWTLAARNALLVAYAGMVVTSLRDYPASGWPARPSTI